MTDALKAASDELRELRKLRKAQLARIARQARVGAQRTARAQNLARELERAAEALRASWELASGDAEHEVSIDVESTLLELAQQARRLA